MITDVNKYNPLKPPLAWLGGKSRLREKIIPMIPADHTTYVEVFGGAMWVLFGKGKKNANGIDTVEVYNDANADLVNFWRVVKSQKEAFLVACEHLFASRELYREFVVTDRAIMTEVERAVAFFYLLRLGFGGMIQNDLMIRPDQPPPPLDRREIEGTITRASDRLLKVWIENLDYLELLKRWARSATFFYIDPPYFDTKGYKGEGVSPFGISQHQALYAKLASPKMKSRWMISINDCEWYRNQYKDYNFEEAKVFYSMCKDKKDTEVKELIITNYDTKVAQLSLLGAMRDPKYREVEDNQREINRQLAEIAEMEAELGINNMDTTREEDGAGEFQPSVDDATPYPDTETEGDEIGSGDGDTEGSESAQKEEVNTEKYLQDLAERYI